MLTEDLVQSVHQMDIDEQQNCKENGPQLSDLLQIKENFPAMQNDAPTNKKEFKKEITSVLPANYILSHCLAEGAMGQVYLIYNDKIKDMLAAKVVSTKDCSNPDKIRSEIKHEAEIQRNLSHSHICAVYGVRNTPHYCVIFMELLTGGELFDRIPIGSGLRIQEAFVYYAQILDALNFLHQRYIAHLDVKPENIMLTKRNRAKLIDFGWAADLRKKPHISGQTGTLAYSAPEVISNRSYLGPPADLFSLNITLMTMVTGERCWHRPAITDSNFLHWYKRDFEVSPFDRLPPDLLNFLVSGLAYNVADRLTYKGVISHNWYKRGIKGTLSPVAAPRDENGQHNDRSLPKYESVSSSQPVELLRFTPPVNITEIMDLSYSQPCHPDSMLLQGTEETVDCSQSGFHFSTVMKRMTRFFSKCSSHHTLSALQFILNQFKLLRYAIKGDTNIYVEIKDKEQPTNFRILLYKIAGGLLVDCRLVSGDGLLFRHYFRQIKNDMKSLNLVDETHPYLKLVLPNKPDDSNPTDEKRGNSNSGDVVMCSPTKDLRIQSALP